MTGEQITLVQDSFQKVLPIADAARPESVVVLAR